MDVLKRGIDSHEDEKQTGYEQSRPCVAQALVGTDRRVEDDKHHQRVVALEPCVARNVGPLVQELGTCTELFD